MLSLSEVTSAMYKLTVDRRTPLTQCHECCRVQQALQDPRSDLSPYRQPVTLPLTPLKPLAAPALFLTPIFTASCNHESSMADFYSNHLAAVSEQLCLGTVSAMQQAAVLRQGNITHAVIVCSHAELRHVDSAKELSVADVLHWLRADPQLAQALKSCSAVGVQAKLIPVNVPDQVSFLCTANTQNCGLVACFVKCAQANEDNSCATLLVPLLQTGTSCIVSIPHRHCQS